MIAYIGKLVISHLRIVAKIVRIVANIVKMFVTQISSTPIKFKNHRNAKTIQVLYWHVTSTLERRKFINVTWLSPDNFVRKLRVTIEVILYEYSRHILEMCQPFYLFGAVIAWGFSINCLRPTNSSSYTIQSLLTYSSKYLYWIHRALTDVGSTAHQLS